MLNPLAFHLSPLALIIVCAYSYTKRFTRWAHLFLGLAMGIAPAAAWVAVRGTLDARVLIVTAAVMFWGGGFDILYSCQDYDYDVASGLHSVPRAFGIAGALRLARVFHLIAFAFFAWMLFSFGLGRLAIAGVAITGLALLLRAHPGQGRRPQQTQRRLFHHQRLHLHADSVCRHRRPDPAGSPRLARSRLESLRHGQSPAYDHTREQRSRNQVSRCTTSRLWCAACESAGFHEEDSLDP